MAWLVINDEIINLANERIKLEIEEIINRLKKEITLCISELSPLGLAPDSSVAQKKISELCANAIMSCTQLIWQTLFRFITTSGIKYSEELAPELKNIVKSHLPEDLKNIRECLQPFKLESLLEANLYNTRINALRKIGTEIDLFVQSLKNRETFAETQTQSTVFNIYSPVGAIQTGDSSVAHVIQHIDPETKENLTKDLISVEERIKQIANLPNYPKEEIVELIQEGRNELQKDKPNVTKLRSVLSTVGASIQFVGGLKPAYDSLKKVLSFFGISLP